MKRKEFIKLAAVAGTGYLVFGCKKDDNNPPAADNEAIIIGSGFGGAVAALRLGQAGIQTTVLERGQRWTPDGQTKIFSDSVVADKRSTWMRTESVLPLGPVSTFQKHAGVLERLDYQNIKVYNGAAVGGGSVVYGGMTVQPIKSHFEQVFPSELSYDELNATYYPRVIQMLNATEIPNDLLQTQYWNFSKACIDQTTTAGLNTLMVPQASDWNIIREEMAGTKIASALKGELIYGNNSGSKNSLDKNYLPSAEATGKVTIHALHQVKNITQNSNSHYSLEVQRIDTEGNVVETKTITCKYLFISAGSTGTTEILLRSKAQNLLPDINEHVGTEWGTNGNGMFMRSGLTANTGNKQGSPPISAIMDFNNPVNPVLVECAQFPMGIECNCLLHLGLALNTSRGTMTYNSATDKMEINWPANGNDSAHDALADLVNRLNTANGGVLDTGWLPQGISKDFTYHPLGGVPMGKACDFYGRVKGYDNMYVMDGSIIPGSTACANPSLTIAAIAERNIEKIIAEDLQV